MAKRQVPNKELQWGRTPMGEFFIAVIVTANAKDQEIRVPDEVFVLTTEEEEKLWAFGSKLTIAKARPKGLLQENGHEKASTPFFPLKGG